MVCFSHLIVLDDTKAQTRIPISLPEFFKSILQLHIPQKVCDPNSFPFSKKYIARTNFGGFSGLQYAIN